MSHPYKRPRFSPQRIAVLILLALLSVGVLALVDQVRRGGLKLPIADNVALVILINLDVLIILLLLFVLLRALITYYFERRQSLAGSNLKTRFLLAFLVLSVLPSLALFGVGSLLLTRSIDNYFSYNIQAPYKTKSRDLKRTLAQVQVVLDSYLTASRDKVEAAARTIAEVQDLPTTIDGVRALLPSWLADFGLSGVRLVNGAGEVVGRATTDPWYAARNRPLPPEATMLAAQKGGVAAWTIDDARTWGSGAALALPQVTDDGPVVLLLDQLLPADMVRTHEGVEDAMSGIAKVEGFRGLVRGTYLLNLGVATLLVTFAAVWLAFYLAGRITNPILHLTEATERVADGDLTFDAGAPAGGEIGRLVRSFSKMVEDLKRARAATQAAHGELAESLRALQQRTEFIETILANIGSGVISLDASGGLLTMNPAAREMLGVPQEEVTEGEECRQALRFPSLVEIVARVNRDHQPSHEGHVTLDTTAGERRLRVTARALHDADGSHLGAVVVLDDYTELVRAQKMAAWREVARRIAHEIKNPLTPIRLGTERLRRKLARGDEDFPRVFDEASRIILEEVTGLERLVSEFSDFARMAEASLAPTNLHRTIRDAINLVKIEPGILVREDFDPAMPEVRVDAAQLRRVVVNLVKNAVEAIEDGGVVSITTRYQAQAGTFRLTVADTGPGIQVGDRDDLFLPYFTTKESGTGLGLAIVKHVVTDHRGYIRVYDNHPHGTIFECEIPAYG
jgi:two-component system nitrogen regulation sensor histidine kinase NtrY